VAEASARQLLVVAELGRPHGLRGELTARLHGVGPEELRALTGLVLRRRDGAERPVTVQRIRAAKTGCVLALDRVTDRTAAEEHRGAVLLASRENLPAPAADEWYVADLVGLRVLTEEGEDLGRLAEVLQLPAHDVYVVRGERGEVLLPATEEVVRRVEPGKGRMIVRLLPGLVDGLG
jgi:16S rRNA processing protein RimM